MDTVPLKIVLEQNLLNRLLAKIISKTKITQLEYKQCKNLNSERKQKSSERWIEDEFDNSLNPFDHSKVTFSTALNRLVHVLIMVKVLFYNNPTK